MKSNRPIHVEVSPKHENEPLERMIKRFVKRVKKLKILETVRDHRYYEKPSTKRRKEAVRRKLLSQRNNSKR